MPKAADKKIVINNNYNININSFKILSKYLETGNMYIYIYINHFA